MDYIVIGSTAVRKWFPHFPREPKDLDVIPLQYFDRDRVETDRRIEVLENPVLAECYPHGGVLTPNDLYTLKFSHVIGWDVFWSKNLWDLVWLQKQGCILNERLFNKLYSHWETVHGPNKRSDLQMSGEDFFDNAVSFPLDHDHMHELLIRHPYFKGQERPMYTKILKDGAEVDVCEERFKLLTHKERCNLVIEEVCNMAMERYSHMDYRVAYDRMLKKFILNHAPIWEARFILENYVELHKAPFNYIKHLQPWVEEQEYWSQK